MREIKVFLLLPTTCTSTSDNIFDNMHESECFPQPNEITYPQPPLNSKMPKFNIMGKSDKKRKEIYCSQVVIHCFK